MSKRVSLIVLLCLGSVVAEFAISRLPENSSPQATLVFYRPSRFLGSAMKPSIYVNTEEVAHLDNGAYFVMIVQPGKYSVRSWTQGHANTESEPTTVEVGRDKVQYLEWVLETGGSRLLLTTTDVGRSAVKSLHPLGKKSVISDRVSFLLPEEKAESLPPPEPKLAKLLVSSDPQNAQVYINGELKGVTSPNGLAVDLAAGTYQLRLALAGYRDFTQTLTLSAGDKPGVSATLERAGPPPFAVADITELLSGGVSPKRVAVLVQQRGVSFLLDDDSERK